jgi:GNAT superfamily N-acetyltransferase
MVLIRLASALDVAAVTDLLWSAREAAVPSVPPVVGNYERMHGWLSHRLTDATDCWVTEDAQGLTALLLLEPGWIDQLYVRPDVLGQGIGSELVAKAKELMPDGLQLWTFQSNVRAHKFYEVHGFIAVERTDGSGNEEQAPDVRHVWMPASS